MPNQKQFDTTLQSIRNIDCKLFVLDYDYTILDEISGKTESISLSVNAESDIKRTAKIKIAIKIKNILKRINKKTPLRRGFFFAF